MERSNQKILVVGAGGVLGREIVRLLCAQDIAVVAAYRTDREGLCDALEAFGASTLQLDLNDEEAVRIALEMVDAAIFTPILTVSKSVVTHLNRNQRALFFSSNNVAIDPKTEVYKSLAAAEAELHEVMPSATILRPTMIYGYPGDGNMSRLIAHMRKVKFVPLSGGGEALQQPIYVKDLARIAVDQILQPDGGEKGPLAVAGPRPVSQRQLLAHVAEAVGLRPVLVPLPMAYLAPIVGFLERLGLRLPINAAQLARAGKDKTPPSQACLVTGETSLEQGLAELVKSLEAAP